MQYDHCPPRPKDLQHPVRSQIPATNMTAAFNLLKTPAPETNLGSHLLVMPCGPKKLLLNTSYLQYTPLLNSAADDIMFCPKTNLTSLWASWELQKKCGLSNTKAFCRWNDLGLLAAVHSPACNSCAVCTPRRNGASRHRIHLHFNPQRLRQARSSCESVASPTGWLQPLG